MVPPIAVAAQGGGGAATTTTATTKGRAVNPTVDQIETDRLTRIANEYWAPFSACAKKPYEPRLIDDIYKREINGTMFNVRRIMLLEYRYVTHDQIMNQSYNPWPGRCVDECYL